MYWDWYSENYFAELQNRFALLNFANSTVNIQINSNLNRLTSVPSIPNCQEAILSEKKLFKPLSKSQFLFTQEHGLQKLHSSSRNNLLFNLNRHIFQSFKLHSYTMQPHQPSDCWFSYTFFFNQFSQLQSYSFIHPLAIELSVLWKFYLKFWFAIEKLNFLPSLQKTILISKHSTNSISKWQIRACRKYFRELQLQSQLAVIS
jgi:hypothetical protein